MCAQIAAEAAPTSRDSLISEICRSGFSRDQRSGYLEIMLLSTRKDKKFFGYNKLKQSLRPLRLSESMVFILSSC